MDVFMGSRTEQTNDLFLDCVTKIQRWPRINSCRFPTLPKGCHFVICSPYDGKYKIDVLNVTYQHLDYVKAKKAIRSIEDYTKHKLKG